jgi:hypothetical protein
MAHVDVLFFPTGTEIEREKGKKRKVKNCSKVEASGGLR